MDKPGVGLVLGLWQCCRGTRCSCAFAHTLPPVPSTLNPPRGIDCNAANCTALTPTNTTPHCHRVVWVMRSPPHPAAMRRRDDGAANPIYVYVYTDRMPPGFAASSIQPPLPPTPPPPPPLWEHQQWMPQPQPWLQQQRRQHQHQQWQQQQQWQQHQQWMLQWRPQQRWTPPSVGPEYAQVSKSAFDGCAEAAGFGRPSPASPRRTSPKPTESPDRVKGRKKSPCVKKGFCVMVQV